MPIAIEIVQAI